MDYISEKKVACNTTNSGAIDEQGNLWVWGSTKFGLCGMYDIDEEDPTKKKSAKGKDKNGMPNDQVETPKMLPIYEESVLKQIYANRMKRKKNPKFQPETIFSPLTLLDIDPNRIEFQTYQVSHIAYGSYHAGLVCSDIATNHDPTNKDPAHLADVPDVIENVNVLLAEMKAKLLAEWEGHILTPDPQTKKLLKWMQQFPKVKKKSKEELEEDHHREEVAHAINLMTKKENINDCKKEKGHHDCDEYDIPEQQKIEFTLFMNTSNYKTISYPFIPFQKLKTMVELQLDMVTKKNKDIIAEFYKVMVQLTQNIINQESMVKHRNNLRSRNINRNDVINLKELRDLLLKKRCGHGLLMMFGVANEGRIGIEFPEFKDKKNPIKEQVKKGITNVVMPDPNPKSILVSKGPYSERQIIQKLECGSTFTVVLTTEGLLYSWGFGKSGSLGLGESSFEETPQRIKYLQNNEECKDMIDISCGSSHSLTHDELGRIYSWGNGTGGRLGHNSDVGENAPRQIEALEEFKVQIICAGDSQSSCLTKDLRVFVWGCGLNGRLGNGDAENVLEPQQSMDLKQEEQVKYITMGTDTAFAIKQSRTIFAWGSSKYGKLGIKLANNRNFDLPREVQSLKDIPIFQIASGPYHTLLLSEEGDMYSMGNSKDGKLGYGTIDGSIINIEQPEKLRAKYFKNEKHQQIKFFTQKIIQEEIRSYPLFDQYDNLGRLKPEFKKNSISFEIIQLALGENFQLLMSNAGEIFASGANKYGQLGIIKDKQEEDNEDSEGNEIEKKIDIKKTDDGKFMSERLRDRLNNLEKANDCWSPTKIELNTKAKVKQIAAGAHHAFVVLEGESNVYGWGKNDVGQLGVGEMGDHVFSPKQLKTFNSDVICKQIACGELHSIFLTISGKVYACGHNQYGQCGLLIDLPTAERIEKAGTVPHNTPILIDPRYLDHVEYVACGRFHTIVMKKQTKKMAGQEDEIGSEDDSVEISDNDEDDKKEGKSQICAKAHKKDKDCSQESKEEEEQEQENKNPVKKIQIKHDLYGWGRGYHGQLGIKNLKIGQWYPKKIKIPRDSKVKQDDQPTRYQMICCGEKHTMLLPVNGQIWFAGDRNDLGFSNLCNEFDEQANFQTTFTALHDQKGSVRKAFRLSYKYISSNFNSKLNYAIAEDGAAFVFGQYKMIKRSDNNDPNLICRNFDKSICLQHRNDKEIMKDQLFQWIKLPFQRLYNPEDEDRPRAIHLINSGKDFTTYVNNYRVPYTWGSIRNGRLGIDVDAMINDEKYIKEKKITEADQKRLLEIYDDNRKQIALPFKIPQFDVLLNRHKDSKVDDKKQRKYIRKYENSKEQLTGMFSDDANKTTGDDDVRFEIQIELKAENQEILEKDIQQNDIDLSNNFKNTIHSLYSSQKINDKKMRDTIMDAQDRVFSTVKNFPIDNIDYLKNVQDILPKQIIYNKQLYEIMFSTLQQHPCYLINWITSALRDDINLFQHHPQAFVQHHEDLKSTRDVKDITEKYETEAEATITMDEYSYLITAIFGGLKNIRNDKRILSNLMMINIKSFQYELTDISASDTDRKIPYTLKQVLTQEQESIFHKISRLMFESSYQNVEFINDIVVLIIKKLYKDRKQYSDGVTVSNDQDEGDEDTDNEEKRKEAAQKKELNKELCGDKDLLPIFNYELVINHEQICELRCNNLIKFIKEVIDEILLKNFDIQNRKKGKTDSKYFFSDEMIDLAIKAHQILLKIISPDKVRNQGNQETFESFETNHGKLTDQQQEIFQQQHDQADLFILKIFFDSLCCRLMRIRAKDVISAISYKAYQKYPIMNVRTTKNNFFYIGSALQILFCGGVLDYTQSSLEPLKNFLEDKVIPEGKEDKTRALVLSSVMNQRTQLEKQYFDHMLIQSTIEEAFEPQNQICTMQLRDIVYIHNQLTVYGEDFIYIKDFASEIIATKAAATQVKKPVQTKKSKKQEESESYESEDDEGEQLKDEEDPNEADPLKMIIDVLGKQPIILEIYRKKFIEQNILNYSMNLLIRTRIFESFDQVIRCNDCNALVFEGLIPFQRFNNGINNCRWVCKNRKCQFDENEKQSVWCKNCDYPRTQENLPKDLVFPLYLSPNVLLQHQQRAMLFEKVLTIVPLIKGGPDGDSLEKIIKDKKKKERKKETAQQQNKDDKKVAPVNYDQIKIMDEFLKFRETYINVKQQDKMTKDPTYEMEIHEKEFNKQVEEKLYEILSGYIKINIIARQEHRELQEKNTLMLKEIEDKFKQSQLNQKKIMDQINIIKNRVAHGIGNDTLLRYRDEMKNRIRSGQIDKDFKPHEQGVVLAGSLLLLQQFKDGVKIKQKPTKEEEGKEDGEGKKKEEGKGEEEKESKEKDKDPIKEFFSSMAEKQTLKMPTNKLQKQLESKNSMRNQMKQMFGQFQSFPITELKAKGVIAEYQDGIESFANKCNFLFYEIKQAPDSDEEAGYKVELKFEEKPVDVCGIRAKVEDNAGFKKFLELYQQGQDKNRVGNASQSILSRFTLTNEILFEMRRISATKSVIKLGGTIFNIFKLNELLNTMKTANAKYSAADIPEPKEMKKQPKEKKKD